MPGKASFSNAVARSQQRQEVHAADWTSGVLCHCGCAQLASPRDVPHLTLRKHQKSTHDDTAMSLLA